MPANFQPERTVFDADLDVLVPPVGHRFDIYALPHKALRKAQCDLLIRLGQFDFTQDEFHFLAALIRRLFNAVRVHQHNEETYIHPAFAPPASAVLKPTRAQHAAQQMSMDRLEDMLGAIERTPPAERAETGRQFYLMFSRWVARELDHMFDEEAQLGPALRRRLSDTALMAQEHALIAQSSPDTLTVFAALMLTAVNGAERDTLVNALLTKAPNALRANILDLLEPDVNAADHARFAAALDVCVDLD